MGGVMASPFSKALERLTVPRRTNKISIWRKSGMMKSFLFLSSNEKKNSFTPSKKVLNIQTQMITLKNLQTQGLYLSHQSHHPRDFYNPQGTVIRALNSHLTRYGDAMMCKALQCGWHSRVHACHALLHSPPKPRQEGGCQINMAQI